MTNEMMNHCINLVDGICVCGYAECDEYGCDEYEYEYCQWRDVQGWPDYMVNENGCVMRKKDNKVLKQYVQKSGYAAVYLRRNGWTSAVMVHRIVAQAFLPRIPGMNYVDHINTVRHDNRVANLRWTDALGNANNEATKLKRKRK